MILTYEIINLFVVVLCRENNFGFIFVVFLRSYLHSYFNIFAKGSAFAYKILLAGHLNFCARLTKKPLTLNESNKTK